LRAKLMAEPIAEAFVKHYYSCFDQDRATLSGLYRPESMLSFEGSKIQGQQNIVEKLKSLTFQRVAHRVVTLDCQPSPGNGILVFVSGELVVDDGQQTMRFAQVFNLQPTPGAAGSFFVLNDLFRLNYG